MNCSSFNPILPTSNIGGPPCPAATIFIILSPACDRRGKRRHGRFDARLQGNDGVICAATQQPILDVSRVLLLRGVDPTTVISKVSVDAPAVVRMKAPIGVAAQYDVMGERFVRRKQAAAPMPGSEIENPVSTAPIGLRNTTPLSRASHRGSLETASLPLTDIVNGNISDITSCAKGK
jgi:hypothetical protein